MFYINTILTVSDIMYMCVPYVLLYSCIIFVVKYIRLYEPSMYTYDKFTFKIEETYKPH